MGNGACGKVVEGEDTLLLHTGDSHKGADGPIDERPFGLLQRRVLLGGHYERLWRENDRRSLRACRAALGRAAEPVLARAAATAAAAAVWLCVPRRGARGGLPGCSSSRRLPRPEERRGCSCACSEGLSRTG